VIHTLHEHDVDAVCALAVAGKVSQYTLRRVLARLSETDQHLAHVLDEALRACGALPPRGRGAKAPTPGQTKRYNAHRDGGRLIAKINVDSLRSSPGPIVVTVEDGRLIVSAEVSDEAGEDILP
jgi:hypothetical protein